MTLYVIAANTRQFHAWCLQNDAVDAVDLHDPVKAARAEFDPAKDEAVLVGVPHNWDARDRRTLLDKFGIKPADTTARDI